MALSTSSDRCVSAIHKATKKLAVDPTDKTAIDMLNYYEDQKKMLEVREESEDWKKNNLEYDLRSTQWILEKVRKSPVYAQNLYAAMCNNDFIKNEVWPILKQETWGCSWRHSGGIIADMIGRGDYIDWYCSGIRDDGSDSDYVSEATVTEEIRNDLNALGWTVIEDKV